MLAPELLDSEYGVIGAVHQVVQRLEELQDSAAARLNNADIMLGLTPVDEQPRRVELERRKRLLTAAHVAASAMLAAYQQLDYEELPK